MTKSFQTDPEPAKLGLDRRSPKIEPEVFPLQSVVEFWASPVAARVEPPAAALLAAASRPAGDPGVAGVT